MPIPQTAYYMSCPLPVFYSIFKNIHPKEWFSRQEDKHPNFRWRHKVHMNVYDSKCLLVKHRLHVWCGGQAGARPGEAGGAHLSPLSTGSKGQTAPEDSWTPLKMTSDSGTTQCTGSHTWPPNLQLQRHKPQSSILTSIEHLMQP